LAIRPTRAKPGKGAKVFYLQRGPRAIGRGMKKPVFIKKAGFYY
jgi:hypothetical protein